MKWVHAINRSLALVVPSISLLLGGCGETFTNLTASLGGSRAGSRGDVRLVFINNTPYRPAFTFGTFDQSDPDFRPDASQFVIDGDEGQFIEPNSSTEVGTFQCARIFSVGSPRLLDLIEANLDVEIDEAAFVDGVDFYEGAPENPVLVGSADPFEALLGIDFPCEALLIVYFEENASGTPPFRIDFELIPSSSTR